MTEEPATAELPPPAPKKGKGCLIATLVAIVVGGTLMAVVVYFGVKIWSAFDAEGSEALRQAGCDRGQVADFRPMVGDGKGGPTTLVVCMVARNKEPPQCADIARVYGRAVQQPPPRFVVLVSHLDDNDGEPTCSGVYNAAGELLGEAPKR